MTTVQISLNSIEKVKSFVNDIARFDSDFDLVSGRYVIDAKSIMGIFSLDLSVGEIATYAYLMRCEDRETYQCYPSMATIGDAIGVTKNTVMKYVRGLEEKQLIYTEPTTVWGKGGKKRNGNLLFTIRPIEEAKRYHVEQQMLENERKRLAMLTA